MCAITGQEKETDKPGAPASVWCWQGGPAGMTRAETSRGERVWCRNPERETAKLGRQPSQRAWVERTLQLQPVGQGKSRGGCSGRGARGIPEPPQPHKDLGFQCKDDCGLAVGVTGFRSPYERVHLPIGENWRGPDWKQGCRPTVCDTRLLFCAWIAGAWGRAGTGILI